MGRGRCRNKTEWAGKTEGAKRPRSARARSRRTEGGWLWSCDGRMVWGAVRGGWGVRGLRRGGVQATAKAGQGEAGSSGACVRPGVIAATYGGT